VDVVLYILGPVATAAIIGGGVWLLRDKLGWFGPKSEQETRDRLARVEAQLEELKQKSVAPPRGGAPTDTEALAAAATDETERLLAEAVELQRQHRERDAIERLLTAYNMGMAPEAKAQLHILAGNGFLRLSELEEAESHYLQALGAAERAADRGRQATAFNNLGLVYADRGDLDKAEEHHERALAIREQVGDKLGQAAALANLGVIYGRRGEPDRAEDHLKRALAIAEGMGNKFGQAVTLGNLGNVYYDRGELDKAEQYHRSALAIDEEIANKLGRGNDLGNLGLVYLRRGELEKAEKHYKEALAIESEIGNRLGQALSLVGLGLIAAQRGQLSQGRELLSQAQALFEAIGSGGEVREAVRRLLQLLAGTAPPQAKRETARKQRPRKKP